MNLKIDGIKRNLHMLIAVCFTLIILFYILIRAFNTEFISDETAAYWYFVYRGWFWGDQVVWDAANHPLNSFIGYHLYNLFGDIPGILRIGSLISFLFYAFASYKFTSLLNRRSLQILSFIALTSIPYMLEYFAYFRGYGLSMGFFLCGVWNLYLYAKEQKIIQVILAYLFVFIAFAANLNILNSVILIIIGVAVIHLTHWKKIDWKHHVLVILGTLFLARICWPLIAFALKLKEVGSLYYSSLDGIWDMTGKSLSRYILFTDNNLLMYFFILIFLIFLLNLWQDFRKLGWKGFMQQSNTWVALLFFGNLVAVLLMALLLKINYPEDRTGMHFVPLFFLMLFQVMQRLRYSEWLLLGFPLSLSLNLSIHSSVFIPEERMTNAFYRTVKKQLKPDDVVSIYRTMFANWHYQESHQDGLIHFPHTSMRQGNEADVFIARSGVQAIDSLSNPFLESGYIVIAKDPMNDHVAYRRIKKHKEHLFYEKIREDAQATDGEFIDLISKDSLFTDQEDVRLLLDFHLKIDLIRQSTDVVVVTTDSTGAVVRYLPMVLELNFQSKKLDKQLKFAVMLDNLQPNEKNLKIYLWNRKPGVKHTVSKVHVKAFNLN